MGEDVSCQSSLEWRICVNTFKIKKRMHDFKTEKNRREKENLEHLLVCACL